MKTFLFLLVLAVACTRPAQAQNNQLVIDQAAVLPSLATPGSGSIIDLVEFTDAQGSTYQAGSFTGTVHFGSFNFTGLDTDVVVAKRNAAGVYVWAVAGGGAGTQRAKALAVDAAGNVAVTGSFDSSTASFGASTLTNARAANTSTSDVFVAKVTAGGTWEWAASAGGGTTINGNDYATAIAADLFGNIYVAGTYSSSVAFFGPTIQLATTDPYAAGRETVFIAKLSPTGVWQWARRSEYYGGVVSGVITDAMTNAYFVSGFHALAQFGAYTVTTPYPAGGIAIAKIDGAGAWQWVVKAQNNARETDISCNGLTMGVQNDLYLAGTYNGDTATFGQTRLVNRGPLAPSPSGASRQAHTDNAYLARLNTATGAWRWALQSQGDGYEIFSAPVLDASGGLYLGAGVSEPGFQHSPLQPGHQFGNTTITTAAGSADVIIAKLDTAGTWRWVAQAGGTSNENAAPSYIDGQGRVFVTGRFYGPSLTLGTTNMAAVPTASYTNFTAFTARLGANGPLSTRGQNASLFSVYPNPAHRNMTVTGLSPKQAIQMLDALGRVILVGTMPEHGDMQLELPAGLPAGLYIVRAGKEARRVVVE
ncbi:SBBP repeat-containing protein [Hymenobacter convexus]|uniref:SBBP repeat-containing protein n=1 Tax=Hymenobacter sp. CA1UV-4 TaxID=3063782 RepID=UPI002713249F|nr:SBBP repeat-containing protein [Hymenobacter sp. CA1UV-4]MDO7850753.1 SBBP repeat-containing protein [Hymenobacter sp. CA1UV-4]